MKKILKLSIIIFGIGLLFSSCEKAQEIYEQSMPEAGVYISGSAIYLDSIHLNGLMDLGKIKKDDAVVTRDSLYQKFMYVTASGDFTVSQQIETETIAYGLSGGWTEEETGIWSGTIAEGGSKFKVAEDGFYLLTIDLNLSIAYLFKIDSWYLTGDAVITEDAKIDLVSSDKLDCNWEGTGIEIISGTGSASNMNFSFYNEDTYSISGDSINIVTYLGGAFPEPELGGSDLSTYIDQDDNVFDFAMSYNFLTQFASTNTMPPYDPRVNSYGLIGDAFHQGNDINNAATAWDIDFKLVFDETSDTLNGIYNFIYPELYFIGGKEFKIRLNGEWDPPLGGNYGFNGVEYVTGDVANIVNAGGNYGNFKVTEDAQYNVTFIFNTKTFKKTIDFSAVQ